MQDFAAGTSSRSTKLIHGGLRYLKQLEFKLVAEVGKERKIIHRIAPHLTRPEQMLLPLLKNGSFSKFSARLGMWIYERMAGVSKKEWHKFLSIEKSLVTEPLLNKKNLIGSIVFYEYRTDDARLTIEVIKESVARGAKALNHLKVVSFIYDKKIVRGVEVIDQLNDEKFIIHAKHIINASGPWVDELSILENNNTENKLQITKGVHLVVDWKKLPVKQSLYFDAFDKRMLFIIPRDGKTYIGTTDTFYNENKINPIITKEDRNYILKCLNDFFPQNNLKISDIESAWAGLRPLISKPSKGPSEISRKDEMFESDSGMLTIAGGKLTGYRKMAERIVDKVTKKIYLQDGIKIQKCITHTIQLSGGKLKGYGNFSEFIKDQSQKGILLGLSIGDTETLIYRYGSNVLEIYRIIEELKNEQNELPIVIRAQIRYAIEYEMCASVTDFLIRRTGSLYFNFEVAKIYANSIFKYMQSILNLNESAYHKFESEWHDAILEIENIKK